MQSHSSSSAGCRPTHRPQKQPADSDSQNPTLNPGVISAESSSRVGFSLDKATAALRPNPAGRFRGRDDGGGGGGDDGDSANSAAPDLEDEDAAAEAAFQQRGRGVVGDRELGAAGSQGAKKRKVGGDAER